MPTTKSCPLSVRSLTLAAGYLLNSRTTPIFRLAPDIRSNEMAALHFLVKEATIPDAPFL